MRIAIMDMLEVVLLLGLLQACSSAAPRSLHRVAATDTAPNVTITLGTLSGATGTSTQQQRTFYKYMGIPYGKAPVNESRYKEPSAAEAWSGVFDASSEGKMCIQMDSELFESTTATVTKKKRVRASTDDQSEDCLILNVFVPKVNSSSKLPVLVFVHGGFFLYGSARDLPPNNLMDHDIILVTPQYRLGPLGFLNLQEDDVPGNAGLLDVVLALQWVQSNIEYFGGDPDNVTLGGQSAGSALVSLLYLSPLTQGLMRGVMSMSGSSLTFWAYDLKPEVAGFKFVSFLGCDSDNSTQRLACLRNASTSSIQEAFLLVSLSYITKGIGIGTAGGSPSIQKANATKVLTDLPVNILKEGNFTSLPLYTGVVKHEGTWPLELALEGFFAPNGYIDDSEFLRYDLIPGILKMLDSDDSAGFAADSVAGYFFNESALGNFIAMQDGLVDTVGALAFKSAVRLQALHHASSSAPVYLYTFSHYGSDTSQPLAIYHGYDMEYLFADGTETYAYKDLEMVTLLCTVVSNFVIYQDPNPDNVSVANLPAWEPFAKDSEYYMALDVPSTLQMNFTRELTVASQEHLEEQTTTTVKSTTASDASTTATDASTTASDADITVPTTSTAPSAVSGLTTLLVSFAVLAIRR